MPKLTRVQIVVTGALRTAFTKGGRGLFKDTAASDLLAGVLQGLIKKSGIDPALVDDISVGNVLAPGGGATEFRAAAIVAGFPVSTAVKATNRQCSSGLQACVDIAAAINAGIIEIGIGAGVESMTNDYGPNAVSEFSELLKANKTAADCKVPMGVLSEAMAKDRNVARTSQDAFAAASYQKAEAAQKAGLFAEEIWPLEVSFEDPKSGEKKRITVSQDDGVRPGMTAEALAKIKPAFAKDGSIHAGNASQISDGAAAVLLMKRSTAIKLGQTIIGKFVTAAVAAALLHSHVSQYGAFDVVVHNAGITRDKTIAKMTDAAWRSVLAVNLEAPVLLSEALLDSQGLNPGGRIVCVSSISGIAGNLGQSNYATSKAGVIGLVQGLAPRAAAQQVTVNAVAPGFIETQMTAKIPLMIREAGRRMNSLSQGGQPIDVAETIAWLAHPASGGVNGQVVRVCGQSLLGA